MSQHDFEAARKEMEKAGRGDFEGARTEDLIRKAEAALSLIFPPSYRRFLLELGCGDIGGVEIFGLIDDNFTASAIPNGIWLTLHERTNIALSHEFVLIGEDGTGGYLALDTAHLNNSGEAPVVRLSIDGIPIEVISSSFGKYLLEAVRNIS